jgi:endonuclease YncB( thermonuclease family)
MKELFLATALLTVAAAPQQARVVDGDTIRLGSERVRLIGIDAPETAQGCKDAAGRAYECGKAATAYMRSLVAGRAVSCTRQGEDRYGRTLAECFVAGARSSINADMVRAGWAICYADSKTYRAEQDVASRAHAGLWRGLFENPAEYRRRKRNHD